MTKDELLETLPLCRNCLYFYADHEGREIGLCCRHAPQPLMVNVKKDEAHANEFVFLHPPVLASQYCGDGVRDPRKFGPCEKCKHYDPNGDTEGLHLPSLFCRKSCSPKSCQDFAPNDGDDGSPDVYQD